MQQRRIGTFTFGILLIIVGILYLMSTVFHIPLGTKVLQFWPLVFISLGIEVLALSRLALKKNTPLRYDIISFFLIIVMFFFSYGTFILNTCAEHPTNPNFQIHIGDHNH